MFTDRAASKPPPSNIGDYNVLCELGRGAMAVVYLGRSQSGRLVAIKMIHPVLGAEQKFIDLFLNEGQLAKKIKHPNVIEVHEVAVQENGRHYITMDYVSGETLGRALTQTWDYDKIFPIDIAAHVIASACDGLHAAHELRGPTSEMLGVIHRDVNPKNIMIGYDGAIRIMDFGVAKVLDRAPVTQVGVWRGTAPYLAPEQITGVDMDRRVDTFALGIVLWESVTGKRLFKHDSELGTIGRVLRMEVPPPSTIRPDLSPDLESIIMHALERDVEERYQSAFDLAEDLRDYLSRTPERISTETIRQLMKELFTERHAQRMEMEQQAKAPIAPLRVNSRQIPEIVTEMLGTIDPENEPIDDPGFVRWLENATGESRIPAVLLEGPVPSIPIEVAPIPVPEDEAMTTVAEPSVPAMLGEVALIELSATDEHSLTEVAPLEEIEGDTQAETAEVDEIELGHPEVSLLQLGRGPEKIAEKIDPSVPERISPVVPTSAKDTLPIHDPLQLDPEEEAIIEDLAAQPRRPVSPLYSVAAALLLGILLVLIVALWPEDEPQEDLPATPPLANVTPARMVETATAVAKRKRRVRRGKKRKRRYRRKRAKKRKKRRASKKTSKKSSKKKK